ncbi:TPA: hypothetical protein N0F65_007909 [Lagenidium giganteum]|uniref:Uncharacterized protein n=1 Tax=Lagenidium giganteum TaxID=4803 RepID=A0AAV2Z3Q5_9STRA|nr:TPA: hypothetical protein N0F65_007909 [Lagenidium giganteum]
MPVNRDAPAGIPSRPTHGEDRAAKKKAGMNVERFIAREEELHQARQYTKFNVSNSIRSEWEEKQNLRAGSGARLQKQKQLQEELELMNKEVQIVCHERIKAYYEKCYDEWEEELRARGLALVRDRE